LFPTVPHLGILHSFFYIFQLVIELLLILCNDFFILNKRADLALIWILILLNFNSINLAHIFFYYHFDIPAFNNKGCSLVFITIKKLFLICLWAISHHEVIQYFDEIAHWKSDIFRHLFAIWILKISFTVIEGAWKCKKYNYSS
jgi:hypothetical protein